MRVRSFGMATVLVAVTCPPAFAAKYTVGPAGSGKQYPSLVALLNDVDLGPGDLVEVDGNATYTGSGLIGIRVRSENSGAPGNPVTVRGLAIDGHRPRLDGGDHVIKFEQSNHLVFEGFEITGGDGGAKSCVFSEADNLVLRDLVIHDCPAHGLIAADFNSGSLTLEYSEIYKAGAGEQKHPIYVTADPASYPNAVFRMRFNYIHDGKGGNLLKSRHRRNEIHYNWFENSTFQEIELIGPDCEPWPGGMPPAIEGNSELVGNVIVHKSNWSNVIRLGGDLNGRSRGLVRMANNTVLIDRPGSVNAVYVQLGLKSLEMHNNAIYQPVGTPTIIGENNGADSPICGFTDKRPWVDGVRRVSGGDNWLQMSAFSVPGALEWSRTLRGTDPVLADIAQRNLRPVAGSPLIANGNTAPANPPGFPFPSPQLLPAFHPPLGAKAIVDQPQARVRAGNSIAVGAFEPQGSGSPIRVNGSMPLIPPHAQTLADLHLRGSLPLSAQPAPGNRRAPIPVRRLKPAQVAAPQRPATAAFPWKGQRCRRMLQMGRWSLRLPTALSAFFPLSLLPREAGCTAYRPSRPGD